MILASYSVFNCTTRTSQGGSFQYWCHEVRNKVMFYKSCLLSQFDNCLCVCEIVFDADRMR